MKAYTTRTKAEILSKARVDSGLSLATCQLLLFVLERGITLIVGKKCYFDSSSYPIHITRDENCETWHSFAGSASQYIASRDGAWLESCPLLASPECLRIKKLAWKFFRRQKKAPAKVAKVWRQSTKPRLMRWAKPLQPCHRRSNVPLALVPAQSKCHAAASCTFATAGQGKILEWNVIKSSDFVAGRSTSRAEIRT